MREDEPLTETTPIAARASCPPGEPVDAERVRRLVRDHRDGVTRYLGRLGIPPAEVDDVAQEVLVVAASKLAGVTGDSDRPFLYAIASRVAQNTRRGNLRRHRAYERYFELGAEPSPSPEELSDELRARVLFDSVLREMTPELRRVFLLCEIEGLPVPEIAQRLAIPTGTAASRLRRARATFFERIERARAGTSRRDRSALFEEGPEILSWWVSAGEVDALGALLDIYRRAHPGTGVVHGGVRDTDQAKCRRIARMTGGTPPDTFQANGGYDLLQWTRGPAGGSLEPLEFLFEDEGWRAVLPPELLDLVSAGGEAYGVPLNIHRTNTLVYDLESFARADLSPPRTLDELHAAAGALRRRGLEPLALGTRHPWMLSLLAFENLLVSIAGPRFYVDLMQCKGSPRAPEVRAAIEELGRLLDIANPDADRLGWDEAADRVRIGAAAMTLGGDWSKGYLERRGCLEGEHFGLAASPGTEHVFVFTIDAFALPRGAPHREEAIELLRVFGSRHGQHIFNRIKGSRPARSDVAEAPSCRASPSRPPDFEVVERVPTLTSLVPPSFSGALDAALAEFARTRDVGEVLRTLERHYAFHGN